MNIRELYRKYELLSGKMVQIEGWIRTNRASKAFGFLEVNDGTFFRSVQVVYEEAFLENFVEISKLLTASAIAVQGVVEMCIRDSCWFPHRLSPACWDSLL